MKHTLGYIMNKPDDFKVCKVCGTYNWYERVNCLECENVFFIPLDDEDILGLAKECVLYGDYEQEV